MQFQSFVRAHARRLHQAGALQIAGGCLAALLATQSSFAQTTRAYVTTSANVVAIDPATNTVATTIPIAAGTRVAVDLAGSRAYVAQSSVDSVAIINTTNDTVAGSIAVGDNPNALALSPDGQRLYVSVANALQVFDTASATLVASINIVGGSGVAVSPDGARVYVAAGHLLVIDAATNTVVNSISPGDGVGATGVVLTPDGKRAYVPANALFGGVIAVIDTESQSLAATIGFGSLAGQIAISPDGSRVYVGVSATFVDTGYGAGFLPGRSVAVIDTLTNSFAGMIDLGADGANWTLQNTAAGIAVSADRSKVLIAVPRLSSVAIADVNSNVVTTRVAVSSGPNGIGARPGGATLVPYVIDAVNDAATISAAGGTAIATVLTNDRLGGLPVTTAHVTLSERSSTHAGLSLDAANGAVNVAADTPVGVHTLVYRICEKASPSNCDDATATITVRAPYVIDAVDDSASSNVGRTAIANVLANDRLNGAVATVATVRLTQLSSSSGGITLNVSNGSVFVAVGTAIGAHSLTYRICEIASAVNCDIATVSINVLAFAIDAVNDTVTAPRTGGIVLANVLVNDTFAGAVATLAKVSLAQVATSSAAVSLNTSTGAVSVTRGALVGTHTLTYRICELASPSNCDQATVTVNVSPYVIDAVNDSGRGSSKIANTPIASVLANDWFAGARATTSTVSISLVSMSPANSKIRLDTTDGSIDVLGKTESGLYTIDYRICEKASPSNCDQASVSLDLSGK